MEGKTRINPLGGRVVVERDSPERTLPSGILIPDTAAEKPIFGTVRAVGADTDAAHSEVALNTHGGTLRVRDGASVVQVGDRVLFGRYSGTEVEVDGKTLLVILESDLMAVVSGGAS